MYERSITDSDDFWAEQAEALHWNKGWSAPLCQSNINVENGPVHISWFVGAETNMAYNCLDRHIEAGHGDRVAIFWEGNDEGEERVLTYSELKSMVCRIANYLKSLGVKRGSDVTMYMSLVPELPAAMLACARIGAVHSVVFGGFSAEALSGRILDSQPNVVITSSGTMRGPKPIGLKAIVDDALDICEKHGHTVQHVLMLEQLPLAEVGGSMKPGRDVTWREAVDSQSDECPVEWLPAEAPLFKLYTSGSTGKPKGVLHTTAGYMLGALVTTKYVFDVQPATDVYWCTADCGWITGHTYVAYGPLLLGATQVLFEGVPTWPDAGRCWSIVDKYKVTIVYTAPTAIRALHAKGDAYVTRYSRASLRLLGSVGEPINPEAWRWYHQVVGDGRCPIMDTWWQTETGGHMITPLPGATPLKPGSATLPFFGVEPVVLDEKGNELQGPCEGVLCIKKPWPSMMRTVAGDHARFEQTYFSAYKGYYFTGDGCRRDADGYYWITGRVDDVLNVSGHRIGTAEVESALVEHPSCVEAAVVGVEHPIKGQSIYAFVTLMTGVEPGDALRKELISTVRKIIGPFAAPDVIHWAPGLPKTRSGKIMRRVLRKIAAKEEDQLGDTSTLADPSVVQVLVELRGK
ncbi:hypothetical protein CHLRE_01g071662v5 [Chlamydomonas reinhardtii]|uniref:Acetyl-coenzyme A synthetase n=1 Tax=Chlamydomonas reinhardtii TaxID=3055 RepID=A0A2K3E8I5_CHLRE|nr:uncharacterized protein CHLRE_01g071662v5 [Chlamydomonas reinhardtii]PNW89098.1 hypothetical protein CHLRE_01g071662v5 [Chlamydomonas reinhardtii]